MSFNRLRRKRDPFGPRFGELMGKHCHAALTAAAKGNRDEYDRLVKELYQMLDSIDTETEWPEEEKKVVKKDEPTPVAPESKQAPKRTRSKSPAKKRTAKATKLSDGYGDND